MGFFLQKLSNSYSAVDPPFFLYLWQNKIFFTFKIYICQRWNFTHSCILYNNIIYKLCNNILFNILYIQSKAEFVSIVAPGSRVLWSLSSEKILLSHFERISVKIIFCLFVVLPVAYGGSQARCQIGHSHNNSNMGSDRHLWPTPWLTAMADP